MLTALGLFVACLTPKWTFGQPAEEPAPVPQPTGETAGEVFHRLTKTPTKELTRPELALRAGLDFCIAIGAADGKRAAGAVDVVGYQALPLEGKLPETAEKPLSPVRLADGVSRRTRLDVDALPAAAFEFLAGAELARQFPAVSEWMLAPQDFVILVRPGDPAVARWISRPACIVVRIRGQRAAVVGGNLLAALTPKFEER